jgi:hypothetical protein
LRICWNSRDTPVVLQSALLSTFRAGGPAAYGAIAFRWTCLRIWFRCRSSPRAGHRGPIRVLRTTSQPILWTASRPILRTTSRPIRRTASRSVRRTASRPIRRTAAQPVRRTASRSILRTAARRPIAWSGKPARCSLSRRKTVALFDLNMEREFGSPGWIRTSDQPVSSGFTRISTPPLAMARAN